MSSPPLGPKELKPYAMSDDERKAVIKMVVEEQWKSCSSTSASMDIIGLRGGEPRLPLLDLNNPSKSGDIMVVKEAGKM